ncbi:hypothetical protein CEG14_09140 [Bordetella genomosp. 1]|uniref:Glycine zipper domain-containing protein n=1 Tax=Bordetella genomosp. 1 TaxID=1395607 RepID=A0A261SEM6_9BORD|nr:hypothetical protein [Bordetella genomosp. 1]OZI35260.1 hypothetical protein CEG14_09140 [Bordetella genomosp. 1]
MSLIVAARFQTFEQATLAAGKLFSAGFREEDVHTFYVNTPGGHARFPLGGDRKADPDAEGAQYGAIAGAAIFGLVLAVAGGLIGARISGSIVAVVAAAGVGAYLGALGGAMWLAGRRKRRGAPGAPLDEAGHPEVRPAGVLLALHITPDREAEAVRILRGAGGQDVERAHGRWRDGRWVDFDPLVAPEREPATVPAPGGMRSAS